MKAAPPDLASRLRTCQGVMVDSSILLELLRKTRSEANGRGMRIAECSEHRSLVINPIIYAEVSIGYTTIEALDRALPRVATKDVPSLGKQDS